MSKILLKTLTVAFLAGFSSVIFAEDKVVWSPKDQIGKNKTWTIKSTADLDDGALNIHYTGDKWSEAGLNWQNFYPADSGIKVADYKYLIIQFKAMGAPEDFQLTLKDNKQKNSGTVKVKEYCPDGELPTEFTSVKIPIKDFLTAKSKFETGVVWAITMGMWTKEEKSEKISVNKISFSKK